MTQKLEEARQHPQGHHSISVQLARNMQTQYTRSIGMKKISLKEGDRLCKICYYRERARFDKLYSIQGESMEICDEEVQEDEDSIDASRNMIESELEEDNECDPDESNDDCFHSSAEEQKKNKQTLNSIFELLGISPITDM